MPQNFAQVWWPGVIAYESCSITDNAGIAPSVAILKCIPQDNMPDLNGDLRFTYNDTTITWYDCVIDSFSVQRDSGGKIVSVRILDGRWRWRYGQITGRYNIRLPNNFVDPKRERTPQQLASLCFDAMGVTNYNVTDLPNESRPDVDWYTSNPAEELATICDALGCRVVPIRSTGAYKICVTGSGANLPDDLPYQDGFDGLDAKRIPDYIQCVTGPVRYQVALQLKACGKDTDQSWRDLNKLTYCPTPTSTNPDAFGFGYDYNHFAMKTNGQYLVSNTRIVQGDGTKISPRELAEQTVFKCWRVDDEPTNVAKRTNQNGDKEFFLPGLNGYVTRKQLILSDELVQSWTDYRGEIHTRPSFIWGEFKRTTGSPTIQGPNYPQGTRIDYQGNRYVQDPEEPSSFSINIHPIDTDLTIIQTSKKMMYQSSWSPGFAQPKYTTMDPAKIFYTCAVQVREPTTWQPISYAEIRQIGNGGDTTHVWTLHKPDIQPWFITLYKEDGKVASTSNNGDEVRAQCNFYLDQIQKTLETVFTGTRTYIGIFPIDMDGAIQQVTYRIGKSGADTIVSRGTEHNWDTPTYAEQRQRDGRRDIAGKLGLLKEILTRQMRLQGTFNT